MNSFEEKLKRYIKGNSIDCGYLTFDQSCHSVREAALAAGADVKDFVKNICFAGPGGKIITAIVKGEDGVSATRIGQFLGG